MLDTVLKIGKILRESKNNLRFHRFIKQPNFTIGEKADTLFFKADVDENFNFEIENLEEIPENEIGNLFYANLKTSEADSVKKYFFGDLKISKEELQSSKLKKYNNYAKQFEKMIELGGYEYINKFRRKFEDNLDKLQEILLKKFESNSEKLKSNLKDEQKFVYLSFSYQGKFWYEFENSKKIFDEIILSEFTKQVSEFTKQAKEVGEENLFLSKFLYKTLVSTEKDKKTPDFLDESLYKTRIFKKSEFWDLVFAIDCTLQKSYKTFGNIKIYVLPNVDNLNSDEIEKFFDFGKSLSKAEKEVKINSSDELGSIFDLDWFNDESVKLKISTFDVVFSLKGSNTESDLVEISSLEKSFLNQLFEKYSETENGFRLAKQKEKNSSKTEEKISIVYSFKVIFGKFLEKKFQNHLLKVLPKIYTGTYFEDPILLSEFIERVTSHIRNESKTQYFYNDLKWNFYFLTSIQNLNQGGNLETMKNSKSYELGLLLGELSRPFGNWKEKCPIQSWEKNYAGNLLRRVANLDDLVHFSNDLHQKLVIHELMNYNEKKISENFFNLVKELWQEDSNEKNEKYDKELFAFGFFEGFFKIYEKTKTETNEEN